MGGIGSGRPQSGRAVCEEIRRIDLAYLDRHLGSTRVRVAADESGAVVRYVVRGQDYSERVPFTFTRTMFGGRRRWFLCPSCRRQCRILYIGPRLCCRRCGRLLYASQRATPWQSALWRADALRERLGERLGRRFDDGDGFPPKPARMRWRTYRRLEAQFYEADARWAAGLMACSVCRVAETAQTDE